MSFYIFHTVGMWQLRNRMQNTKPSTRTLFERVSLQNLMDTCTLVMQRVWTWIFLSPLRNWGCQLRTVKPFSDSTTQTPKRSRWSTLITSEKMYHGWAGHRWKPRKLNQHGLLFSFHIFSFCGFYFLHLVGWIRWCLLCVFIFKFKIQNRYASDLFVELHALAIQLVKNGKCYVCFQTSEEIEVCREVRLNSRRFFLKINW